MRRFLNVAAVVGALSLSGLSAAQTQTDYYPGNMSFRLGGVFPIDDNLSSLGSTLFGIGIDYRLNRPLLTNGESYFSLDVMFATTTGRKGSVLPFCINHRWFTKSTIDNEEGNRSYIFAGIGAFFVD